MDTGHTRRWPCHLVLVGAIAIAGCSSSDEPKRSALSLVATPVAQAFAAEVAGRTPPRALVQVPPLIGKPARDMDEADWDAYFDQHPQVAFIRVTGAAPDQEQGDRRPFAAGGAQTTDVGFYPVRGTHEVNIDSDQAADGGIPLDNGRLIGKFVNEGTRAVAGGQIIPALTPRSVYYVVAQRFSATEVRLVIARPSGGTFGREYPIQTCHDDESGVTQVLFEKSGCTSERIIRGQKIRDWVGIGWFTCAQGCCASGGGRDAIPRRDGVPRRGKGSPSPS